MLDGSVIAFFNAKAGDRGYQTLINLALAAFLPWIRNTERFLCCPDIAFR